MGVYIKILLSPRDETSLALTLEMPVRPATVCQVVTAMPRPQCCPILRLCNSESYVFILPVSPGIASF